MTPVYAIVPGQVSHHLPGTDGTRLTERHDPMKLSIHRSSPRTGAAELRAELAESRAGIAELRADYAELRAWADGQDACFRLYWSAVEARTGYRASPPPLPARDRAAATWGLPLAGAS